VPGDGNGSFFYAITCPAIADFNGDGKLDAAYGKGSMFEIGDWKVPSLLARNT
jgi:hypothetical protein